MTVHLWLVIKARPNRCNSSDLLVISCSSTCFGRLYAHHQEVRLLFTGYGFLSCKRKTVWSVVWWRVELYCIIVVCVYTFGVFTVGKWIIKIATITAANAHTSAASSRLNWRPRRFKRTRPFRRKTKSGFCACDITFQTQSNNVLMKGTVSFVGVCILQQRCYHQLLEWLQSHGTLLTAHKMWHMLWFSEHVRSSISVMLHTYWQAFALLPSKEFETYRYCIGCFFVLLDRWA